MLCITYLILFPVEEMQKLESSTLYNLEYACMPTYNHKTALSVNDKTCIIHLAIVVLHYNDNMSRLIKYISFVMHFIRMKKPLNKSQNNVTIIF